MGAYMRSLVCSLGCVADRFYSIFFFFFSSRRRHTRCSRDWSSDVCSSDLAWLLRRATTIETALIDLEVVTEEPKLKARFDTVDGGILLASAFRSLADESRSLALVLRYEARLRRIHQQNYDMLLRVRQDRQPEPAPPEPPPAPAPTPPSAPPTPPPAIPLTEAPVVVAQADRLHETKGLQNEPAAQHRHRRFRSRRE